LDTKEGGWTEQHEEKALLADIIKTKLIENAPIMKEYFGLNISSEGKLESLPLLLENDTPNLGKLPIYLLKLATEIDWECEEKCFKNFCQQTSEFYAAMPNIENVGKEQHFRTEHVLSSN